MFMISRDKDMARTTANLETKEEVTSADLSMAFNTCQTKFFGFFKQGGYR